MPALDFPAAPVLNQLYPQPPVVGQPVYTWDGAKWTTGNSVIQAMGEPSNAIPRMDGDPAEVGTAEDFARGDHRHPVDASRAPIASPHFIGVPTAPTPAVGDNDEKIATTAFVTAAAFVMGNALPSNSDPLMDGNPHPGTAVTYSRDDHVHPVDVTRAPLNSPVFTGTPEASTAAPGTNNTQLATTAFVEDAILASGGLPSNTIPLVDSGLGVSGTSLEYSRADHVHPAGPPLPVPATVAPIMDSVAAVGVGTKYAREDHVHPSDSTKVSQTAMDTALAGKANTGHSHFAVEITNFSEAVDDRVGSLLVAGSNIVLDYNDTANTLTVTSTAAGGGGGTGDVVGPVSSVNDRIATFSGTTGKLIKDSGTLVTAVQPLDAELTAIAGLVSAADRVPYFTGVGAAALTPFTNFGRSLIDDVDAAAAKTTLGIAGAALTAANDTNVQLTTGGAASTSLLAAASVTAGWAGTLSAARGGFGANVSAQSGVPLFTTGVATFTGTNGTGNFVRTDAANLTNATATTPAAADNDTSIATTAFVKTALTGSGFPAGTVLLFYNASAPTGWTKLTTQNDKALRVVSGTGGVAGGTNAFSTVMAQTVVGSTTLTAGQIPYLTSAVTQGITTYAGASASNTFPINLVGAGWSYNVCNGGSQIIFAAVGDGNVSYTAYTQANNTISVGTNTTGGGTHNHPVTMEMQYIDVIIASKD